MQGSRRIWLGQAGGVALALLLGACVTTGVKKPAADIQTDSRVVYYDVSGKSAADLYTEMRAKGMRAGGFSFGEHDWELQWTLTYKDLWCGRCEPASVQVRLKSHTVLPRWTNAAVAPVNLRAQWEVFVAALEQHQQGHEENAVKAARALAAALQELKAESCTQINASVAKLSKEIVNRYRARDEQYDRTTRKGYTQGVAWPPARGQRVSTALPAIGEG